MGSNPAGRTKFMFRNTPDAPMLRFILLLLAGLWFIPRLLRALSGRGGGHGEAGDPRASEGQSGRDSANDPRLSDLTQQDISDADFEEISEEE